jgi:hypothetical protein
MWFNTTSRLSDIDASVSSNSSNCGSSLSNISESSSLNDISGSYRSIESDVSLELASWSVRHNISHYALGDLLKILKPKHPTLPTDPRTFLSTPRNIVTEPLGSGEMYYFGLKDKIVDIAKKGLTQFQFPISQDSGNLLSISLSTDGLPLSRSSKTSFWPILGILDQAIIRKPFLIALYSGKAKPTDVSKFFEKGKISPYY